MPATKPLVTAVDKLDALQAQLRVLQDSAGTAFEPLRFFYIQSLARRALEYKIQRPTLAQLITQKACDALSSYQADLTCQHARAATLMADVTNDASLSAESSAALQRLLVNNDIKALQRLTQHLSLEHPGDSLAALNRDIATAHESVFTADGGNVSDSHCHANDPLAGSPLVRNPRGRNPRGRSSQYTFEELLQQQERDTLQAFRLQSASDCSVAMAHVESGDGTQLEFKAMRAFRQSKQKDHAQQLVSKVISEVSENAGPLNAQMLMQRSLSAMRELSPAYLALFLSHIETLLWLETVAKKNK